MNFQVNCPSKLSSIFLTFEVMILKINVCQVTPDMLINGQNISAKQTIHC